MPRPWSALLLLVGGAGVFAACGTIEDEGRECTDADDDSCGRPLDLEYMTAAIFAPACGQTQCHSRFHQAADLSFDNPADARRSLVLPRPDALLQFTTEQYDPRRLDGRTPGLIRWVTEIDPFARGIGRMPFDAPLANRDIELLEIWIREPFMGSDGTRFAGGRAFGAQCNPELFNGEACNFNERVRCTDDWNFGERIQTCSSCTYNLSAEPATLVCVP